MLAPMHQLMDIVDLKVSVMSLLILQMAHVIYNTYTYLIYNTIIYISIYNTILYIEI